MPLPRHHTDRQTAAGSEAVPGEALGLSKLHITKDTEKGEEGPRGQTHWEDALSLPLALSSAQGQVSWKDLHFLVPFRILERKFPYCVGFPAP